MFVIMCINLLAVRLLLQVLGETDYGIFNVVGGIVTMLSFLSSSMSSATMRFFSYNIGKGDNKNLRKLFSVSLMVYIGIIIISIGDQYPLNLAMLCNTLVEQLLYIFIIYI